MFRYRFTEKTNKKGRSMPLPHYLFGKMVKLFFLAGVNTYKCVQRTKADK